MSEIEKQFYKTFDVEQKYKYKVEMLGFENSTCIAIVDLPNMNELQKCYGERLKIIEKFDDTITDRILLELICILTAWHLDEREPYEITSYSVKTLKKEILEDCINLQNSQKVQYKIQALFKENN